MKYMIKASTSCKKVADSLQAQGWEMKEDTIQQGFYNVEKYSNNIKEAVADASNVARSNAVHIPKIYILHNDRGIWFGYAMVESFIARKKLNFYKYSSAIGYYKCTSRLKDLM
jgi:hypothetical protein